MKSSPAKIAVATTSALAADAAREVAELGGNAVDCGIAAAMCSINTQPGVCALAGSAFVTIWPPDGEAITVDGNVTAPGLGRRQGLRSEGHTVSLDYGGGVTTVVGASSVAVPGTPAALASASQRFGRLSWQAVVEPSVRAAREGFPFPAACHYYLGYSGNSIFGRSAEGHGALHDADGRLREVGAKIVVPGLADSLLELAESGVRAFYEGEIGRRIVAHIAAAGGLLSTDDLCGYEATTRPALGVGVGDWTIAMNPLPAIGGVNVAAMLLAFGTGRITRWDIARVRRLVATQHAVLAYRARHLDRASDPGEAARRLLDHAGCGNLIPPQTSGSTVHTSAVDSEGLACSITASSGYGSGEMAPGTGLWLNNSLGELELIYDGLAAGPPGRRLPSNMAPGVARAGPRVLAFGSPGADRITTATHQFLVNFLQRNDDLETAIGRPRLHLRLDGSEPDLAVEPGIDLPELDVGISQFDSKSMYFGGVVAALSECRDRCVAAADPRREGGTYIGP